MNRNSSYNTIASKVLKSVHSGAVLRFVVEPHAYVTVFKADYQNVPWRVMKLMWTVYKGNYKGFVVLRSFPLLIESTTSYFMLVNNISRTERDLKAHTSLSCVWLL